MNELVLSTLGHTWILDLDGTIVKHNGYKKYGVDSFLDGAKEFLESIPKKDMIIFLTSRSKSNKKMTEIFLSENNVRYDYIIYGVPYGERIVINDNKPSGLKMGFNVTGDRDTLFLPHIIENPKL
ncbi:MAG: hypothetical protein HFG69_17475 [Hungatella sp.]|nr:hypothetical protein [Hungatella sp.]